jgi:hypothetical protein
MAVLGRHRHGPVAYVIRHVMNVLTWRRFAKLKVCCRPNNTDESEARSLMATSVGSSLT